MAQKIVAIFVLISTCQAFFVPTLTKNRIIDKSSTIINVASSVVSSASGDGWFGTPNTSENEDDGSKLSIEQLKIQVLQLGAALDRGQSYNPTSGEYYASSMNVAKSKILQLIDCGDPIVNIPQKGELSKIKGEWELVLTTVKHGIFRSSPFFLAVQESFGFAEEKEAFGEDKASLFFKLHELQTCSWGVSKIGRVAQRIDPEGKYIYSEFDTSIFSLTVIPIVGWFKLLPTFGGCVVTASKCEMEENGLLTMEVDYTTSRPVEGLNGLFEFIWSIKVPVSFFWKLLPWNKGRAPTCSVRVKYVDDDFRIVEDKDGDLFVYSRPVVPRGLEIDGKIF